MEKKNKHSGSGGQKEAEETKIKGDRFRWDQMLMGKTGFQLPKYRSTLQEYVHNLKLLASTKNW